MTTKSAIRESQLQVNRRDVLLGVIAFVGGAASLSSCSREAVDKLELHAGDPLFFDADQMRTLGRVVDLMIPDTDTPGALAAGGDIFIDRMMATWAAKDTQQKFLSVLQGINAVATEKCGRLLADCDAAQQEQLLRDIDSSAFGDDPDVAGFRDLKYLIFAAYYTSEIGATVELQYELVPGKYIPCAPIEEIGRAWAHR
jgi:glucoside 3-dehydrogenase (cytochrome c) hitch-hiker subunit